MTRRDPRHSNPEFMKNVRALYAGGMAIGRIAKNVRASFGLIKGIVADLPDPHRGQAQRIATHFSDRRRLSRVRVREKSSIEELGE